MKPKDDVLSLQFKDLIYVCEDEPKQNLIITFGREDNNHYVRLDSIAIPLKILQCWWEG